jgi:cytidyltransferase-like protein
MGERINFNKLREIRQNHNSIAFCSGCYDLLHSGQVYFFKQCKEYADVLVVSVGSDLVIKQLKGENRPIISEENRLYCVSSIQNVDYAILGDKKVLPGKIDFEDIIKELKPDVFILNDDDSGLSEKKKLCDELGIKLELVKRILPDGLTKLSTSDIIKRING